MDNFYRNAFLWGALTDQPLAVISVPVKDWQALSKEERESLEAYAASFVDAVRASPFDFTNIPASAPVAPTIRKKAAAMTSSSWGVMTGAISADGRNVMSDVLAVTGQ
jgi:hypothetical protein